MMKTYSPKPEHIVRRWYVLDADGQVLGRVATQAAALLRGKHKPIFAPHMDTGDHVVIVNANKVELTGNKRQDKFAYRHSGYPGGITAVNYGEMLATRPAATVEKAVRGMLPKNRLGRQQIRKLHVVPGPEHPHQAQKPIPLGLEETPAWEGLPQPAAPVAVKPKPKAEPKPEAAAEEAKPKPTARAKTTATKPKAKTTASKPKTAAKPKTTPVKPKAKTTAAKPKTAAKAKPKAEPSSAESEE
jgi:large subunit ribosomal protein L13